MTFSLRQLFKRMRPRRQPAAVAPPPDQRVPQFIEHNRRVWADYRPSQPQGEILVDYSATPDRMIAWSYYANLLARKTGARLVAFSSRWKTPAERTGGFWEAFQAINCTEYIYAVADGELAKRARELEQDFRGQIKVKGDVLRYTYQGLELGIDFYDSYLRYCNEGTVRLEDPKFWDIVRTGFGIFLFWEKYLEAHSVKAVFASQPIYLRHGMLCRLAWSRGIPVINGSLAGFWLDRHRNGVSEKFLEYPELFRALPKPTQVKGLRYARHLLQKRLAGTSPADLFYMKSSSFKDGEGVEIPQADSSSFKVVICSHDFFDNPRAQLGMIFEDYYEWLKFLGEFSEKTDYIWYIKVHPNANDKAWEILRTLAERYRRLVLLPPGISHHQLVRSGVRVALTCYGTVAFEYPLLGVPVINATSNNPSIAYDFCHHARTPENYLRLLENLEQMKAPDNLDPLYENFFMHNFPDVHANYFIEGFLRVRRELGIKKIGSNLMFDQFMANWTPARHEKIVQWVDQTLDKMLAAPSRYTTQKTEVDEIELETASS
jgi:hypothetical protein